jgi:putative flippase GtrA
LDKKLNLLGQFIAYTGVGAIGTAAHYLVLVVLVELLRLEPVTASSCGAITGAIVNYILNYKFTFKSRKKHSVAATRFMLVALAGFFVNLFMMWLFTSAMAMNYLLAQVIATGVVLVTNYSLNRIWTF